MEANPEKYFSDARKIESAVVIIYQLVFSESNFKILVPKF